MNLGSSYLPLLNCRNLLAINMLITQQGSVKRETELQGCPSPDLLKIAAKQQGRWIIPDPCPACQDHACYYCFPWNCPSKIRASSPSWKPSGFVTEYWNLVPGKQQREPKFPFQMQHVNIWLGSLPSRASTAQSNGRKGRCWRASFSMFPLSQTGFQSLGKVLLSLVPFIIFTLGHLPFSSRRGKRIHPGCWSQLLTIHYT